MHVAVPPPTAVEVFENSISPIMDRIRQGIVESRTLAALRDALLPKLISGELRVVDVDRFLEKATA